jgi:hypothetical protein
MPQMEVKPLLIRNTKDFARRRPNLDARAARLFITRALPSSFISYYPTLLLLDKMTLLPPPGSHAPLAGLAAAARDCKRWWGSRQGTGE